MDALILSCGTGGGHNAAGTAIAEELKRRGHRVTMFNPYTLHSKRLAKGINSLYIGIVQKTPAIFGALYGAGQLYRRLPVLSPVYYANRGMVPSMREYLERNHFDIIIALHLFPAEILTYMKHQGIHLPKTVFVATDYVCIPFTEETDCDAYIIPSPRLKTAFADCGLPAEKIYPLGIPVQSSFSQKESQAQLRRRLGLAPDKKYILAAGGSMGGGKIKKAIRILIEEVAGSKDTELIVVCGSNQPLYEELHKNAAPNVTVLSFTSNMAEYMKAADLFVTKPGGLSTTEAAVCGVPIVHTAAIPGCETYNANFFSEQGMSLLCRTSRAELTGALDLLSNRPACDAMIANQQKQIRPDASARIVTLAEKIAFPHLESWNMDMEEAGSMETVS